jgi:hypothetical protein
VSEQQDGGPDRAWVIAIKTVSDFLVVPAEKRAHCLKDFAMWLEMVPAVNDMFGDIEGVRTKTDTFIWIDDGKHDAHIEFVIVEEGPKP